MKAVVLIRDAQVWTNEQHQSCNLNNICIQTLFIHPQQRSSRINAPDRKAAWVVFSWVYWICK